MGTLSLLKPDRNFLVLFGLSLVLTLVAHQCLEHWARGSEPSTDVAQEEH